MKKILLISSLLCIMISCSQPSYKSLTVDEFDSLLKGEDIQRIDVRTKEEFEEGHIDFFSLLDYVDSLFIEKADSLLDKSKPVAVYCRTGRRSKQAAETLSKHGFTVYELDRGITEWKEKDMTIIK